MMVAVVDVASVTQLSYFLKCAHARNIVKEWECKQILILQLFQGNWFKTVIVFHLFKEMALEQLISTLYAF